MDGHWQATCDVQDAGDGLPCLLAGYTMGVRGYPTINLTRHLVTGMARRDRLAMGNKGDMMTDLLNLCRTSVVALYDAFPTVRLSIPTTRKQFNEEQAELQEAATKLGQLFALTEDESTRFIPDFIADAIAPARADVAAEAADVLYCLMGILEACGITPDELEAATVAKCAK